MVASYVVGRIKYPIGYNVPRLALYFFSAIALWIFSEVIAMEAHPWITMAIRTPLLLLYIFMAMRLEHVSLRDLIPHRTRP